MGMGSTFARIVGGALKESMSDMIRLDTMEDDETFVLKDGSLMSVILLEGSLRQPGEPEIMDMVERLRIALSPYLAQPGYAIDVNFMRDAVSARSYLQKSIDVLRASARSHEMDLDDVLAERVATLSSKVTSEFCLISVYTRTSILTADESKVDTRKAAARTNMIPPMPGAQIPGKALDTVVLRHHAFVQSFRDVLRNIGQVAGILTVREAMQDIRAGLYPDMLAEKGSWEPVLPAWSTHVSERSHPGKRALNMAPESPGQMANIDKSNMGVPDFSKQIATRDSIIDGARSVLIGDMRFTAFDMSLAPEVLPNFNDLVSDILAKGADIPWRASMRIESGGVHAQRLKLMYLSIFSWTSPTHNKRLNEAIVANQEIDGKEDAVVRFRMSFSTWAPANRTDVLRRNAQVVSGAVKRWGNTSVDGISGDPLATTLSTCPGITTASTAPVVSGPLRDILTMLPLARQASAWKSGAVMFRTATGKPWAYQPGSSLQTTWVTAIIGTPGSGKSVMLSAIMFASILKTSASSGGKAILPRIGIIDIGPASTGLISLLKEALPPSRRHQAVSQKLKMSRDHAINVFDTPLGMRRPLPSHRSFLVNFMSIVCGTGTGDISAPMRGLISAAIDRAYAMASDDQNPKRYQRQDQPSVDRALDEIGYAAGPETIWWDVVDVLMASGRPEMAAIAQRQAVPVISDLVTAAQEKQISSLYSDNVEETTREPLLSALVRVISEVVRDFEVLSSPTRYSIGSARIVSLDLQEVTVKGTTPFALKQTSLMYMLARHVLTQTYFVDEDDIRTAVDRQYLPEIYLDMHVEQARENLQTPKVFCMDEFHRTGNLPAIVDQLLQDAREGRKFNIDIKIASQLIEDFPQPIIDVLSSLIVCNVGSESSIDYMDEQFRLTEQEKRILRYNLNGPSSKGAPFWAFFRTKSEGQVRQELLLTLGPAELWAFSTTARDVTLRRILYDSIGPKLARRVLAVRFPGGSAEAEIDMRIARLEERGANVDDAQRGNIIVEIANELKTQSYMLITKDAAA